MVFFAGIWRKLLPFFKSVPLNFSICEGSCKNKKYLHIGQKLHYLGIFGLEFENTIVIFDINALEFSNCNVWCKIKTLKFTTKNIWFVYFWAGIWKYFYHIWNQRPRVCLVAKFDAKIRILKFRTENAWFRYFWARNLTIVIFEISTLEFAYLQNFVKK